LLTARIQPDAGGVSSGTDPLQSIDREDGAAPALADNEFS
jgi:hypothetical protein